MGRVLLNLGAGMIGGGVQMLSYGSAEKFVCDDSTGCERGEPTGIVRFSAALPGHGAGLFDALGTVEVAQSAPVMSFRTAVPG